MRRVFVGDFRIDQEERRAIEEVLDIGRLSEGQKTQEFEKLFGRYIGTKYCIATNSGTSALIAGLTALKYHSKTNVKKKSKVITTPLSYVATSNAISLCGLEPIFVDIDRFTFGITPENIERCLKRHKNTKNFSIILPVHLFGFPCDMDAINSIAQKYGLIVVEDSAQAHGSVYKGRKTGTYSLFSIYSFYIAHNIQAGEMGSVNTDDIELMRLVKKIKANGRLCDCSICTRNRGICPRMQESNSSTDDSDPRFTHDIIGYNFKIMETQAALAISQVKKADSIFNKRLQNVHYLNRYLEKYADIIQIPPFSRDVSYLAYPIVIKDPAVIRRKRLRFELEKRGIENRPLFGCIPTQQPAYNYLKPLYQGKLPNAEYIGQNGFYIGCHQYLEKDDLDYIVSVFDELLGKVIKGKQLV